MQSPDDPPTQESAPNNAPNTMRASMNIRPQSFRSFRFAVNSTGTLPPFLLAAIFCCLSSAAALAIEGVVQGPDGQPLAGLSVDVYADDQFTASAAAERQVTDAEGRFRLTGQYDNPVVVEVGGDDGAGRILWDPAEQAERLQLEYPLQETILLLHDNDQHFDFNSADQFLERVASYRQQSPDVWLLNAGDIFTRHADRWRDDDQSYEDDTQWYRQRALGIIEQMNRVGYDAMTLGNHELAYIETFTREALEQASFPLLSANADISTDRLPPVQPQVVFRTSTGRTIAVLGLSTGSADGVKLLSRAAVTEQFLDESQEHDVRVALTHIGHRADCQLAERFPELDVIIGGHSHTWLEEAKSIEGVLVAQAGGSPHPVSREHPKYLGVITLTLENGSLVEKHGESYKLPLQVEAAAAADAVP